MIEKIKKYLSQPDAGFFEGYALLSAVCKNRILLNYLNRKQDSDKLRYELKKYIDENFQIPVQTDIEQVSSISGLPKSTRKVLSDIATVQAKIDPDSLPQHYKILWDETGELYRQMRALHEKLKLLNNADAEQRRTVIAQLDTISRLIRKNWDAIDSFVAKGTQANESSVIDENRINANRKYISDGKKALMSDTLRGAARAKKIDAMQNRIRELLCAGEIFSEDNKKELQLLGLNFDE